MLAAQSKQLAYEDYFSIKKIEAISDLNIYGCNTVIKDHLGYLWIGNIKGLYRFDGSNFIHYQHSSSDTTTLCNNSINCFFEDSHQRLWIGTHNGVCYFNYNKNNFVCFQHDRSLKDRKLISEVSTIFEDVNHSIWLNCLYSGIFNFNDSTNYFKELIPQSNTGLEKFSWVSDGLADVETGNSYFVTERGILELDKTGKQLFTPIQFERRQRSLRLIQNAYNKNELIASYWGEGLIFYNKITRSIHQLSLKDSSKQSYTCVFGILPYKNGYIFNYSSALGYYNSETVKLSLFLHEELESIGNSSFGNPYLDKDGILYIPNSKGLFYVQLNNNIINKQLSIPNYNLSSFTFDKKEKTIYAVEVYQTKNKIVAIHLDNLHIEGLGFLPLKYDIVASEILKQDQRLFIRTNYGLFVFDNRTKVCKQVEIVLPDNQTHIFGRQSHYILFENKLYAREDSVLYEIDPITLHATLYNHFPLCNKENVLMILDHDSQHNIWLTDINNHLYQFNSLTKKVTLLASLKNYLNSSIAINSAYDSVHHNLWIGFAGEGIVVFNTVDKKVIKIIDEKQGYQSTYTSAMVLDEDGYIWCGTNDWLYKINIVTYQVAQYNNNDNLKEFDLSYDLFSVGNHQMMLGTNSPLIINTSILPNHNRLPPFVINSFVCIDKPFHLDTSLWFTNKVVLPPLHQSFNIEFAELDILNGSKWQYTYYLEGLNKEWISLGNHHNILFTNIAPGKYVLHLKAFIPGDDKSMLYKNIDIHIQFAFYQTCWFKILCVVFILAFAIFFAVYYFKQKLKRQQTLFIERNRIAGEMHDDLGLGLTKIKYLSEDLKKEIVTSKQQNQVGKIIQHSNDLIDNLNDIIWTLQEAENTIEDVIYHLKVQCAEMLEKTSIEFSAEIPELIPALNIKPEVKRNIYLLAKEFIHNTIKHAAAADLKLCIKIDTENLSILLMDNGKGFDVHETISNGNGLFNLKKRTELIGGIHTLQSNQNGTRAEFIFPLKKIST